MPKQNTKKQVVSAATTVINDLPALKLSLIVPYTEMGKEKEGASYFIPVKARGTDNKLLKGDGKTPLPSDDGDFQLFVLKDGTYTYEAFQADGRTVRPEVKVEGKKATPHIDWSKTIIDPTIVWPDGKMRDIDVRIKANNPQAPEDFLASRAQGAATRASGNVEQMADDALENQLARLQAELAKRKAATTEQAAT